MTIEEFKELLDNCYFDAKVVVGVYGEARDIDCIEFDDGNNVAHVKTVGKEVGYEDGIADERDKVVEKISKILGEKDRNVVINKFYKFLNELICEGDEE